MDIGASRLTDNTKVGGFFRPDRIQITEGYTIFTDTPGHHKLLKDKVLNLNDKKLRHGGDASV